MGRAITPEELLDWVPGTILSSSDKLGWKGVSHRAYHYAGLDVFIPPLDHFMVVRYAAGQTPMDRCFDDRWSRAQCAPGDASLLTMSQASHWHWTQDVDVSHVYLSNTLMDRVASEVTERSVAEVRLRDVLCAKDPTLVAITDAITSEAKQNGMGGPLYVEALGTQLAVHLLRNYADVRFRSSNDPGRLSSAQLRRVLDLIESRLHEALTLEDMAEAAGLGVCTFSRRFRETQGRAPHAFVIDQRVKRARELLTIGDLAVKEIAASCGFSDQAHMTRVLHARLGLTPAKLRASVRSAG
ncbi:MAG: helix-turn-helix transcriptional regulator [Methyloversatilis sp.]|uniref:helix-turn-helix domain-containing protein n=1 Tax=Methyloversatilis sp. TaxID=2569862 RepID=UPI001A36AFCF|nr:AraC family transcriptional regulator [Methyloversatilis sp.]MBL8475441.1 helix-turn-helix transcriptional regulator [Methyloversatilis sp.]